MLLINFKALANCLFLVVIALHQGFAGFVINTLTPGWIVLHMIDTDRKSVV